MKISLKKQVLTLTLAAGFVGGSAWSTTSHACAAEPLISSVCVMAMPGWGDFGGGMFDVADGRSLMINQETALYSLIGQTYGGSGQVSFKLPDLRGRVVMGAGVVPGFQEFRAGQQYGAYTYNITIANLPAHSHTLTTTTVDTSKLTAATTLIGLSATADLGGVNVSGPASGLTLKASTGGTQGNNPAGASLATTPSGPLKIYSDASPTVDMKAGSVAGNLSLTIASGTTAPVEIGGQASTIIGGRASVAGATDLTGGNAAMPLVQPSLVMTYYIAVQGIYPSRN